MNTDGRESNQNAASKKNHQLESRVLMPNQEKELAMTILNNNVGRLGEGSNCLEE
jgi:hypothetical protein